MIKLTNLKSEHTLTNLIHYLQGQLVLKMGNLELAAFCVK